MKTEAKNSDRFARTTHTRLPIQPILASQQNNHIVLASLAQHQEGGMGEPGFPQKYL